MNEPRKFNRSLDQKPKLMNLIPADLALPMVGIFGVALLAYSAGGVPPFYCLGLALWLSASWWIFAGDKPWLHISRLTTRVPKWGTAQIRYHDRHKDMKAWERNGK